MSEITLEQSLENNRAIIEKAKSQIAREIKALQVPEGRVRFFDGKDRVISGGLCKQSLEIPIGTAKVVANGDFNIAKTEGSGDCAMYVAGNIAGQGLDVHNKYLSVRATGNVSLNNKSKTNILVINGGDTKLEGFTYACVNSGGNVSSGDKKTSFIEITAQGNVSDCKVVTDGKIDAGGVVNTKAGTIRQGGNTSTPSPTVSSVSHIQNHASTKIDI